MAGQGLFFRTFSVMSSGRSLFKNRIGGVNLQISVMSLKQDTLERIKQLKIPEKPKKPISPYMKFVTDHRSIILKNRPDMKQTDLIKKCAEDWKIVDSKVKEKYTERYKLECEAYDEKLLKYNESLTPEQREAIADVENEKKNDRKKRKLRKLYKETNKPKKPAGAYMHYLIEQSKIKNKSMKDLMLDLKGEWANLSETEKAKYQSLYLKEKQKYEAAMQVWESKMLEEGRADLIRVKSLEEKKPSRIKDQKKGGQN